MHLKKTKNKTPSVKITVKGCEIALYKEALQISLKEHEKNTSIKTLRIIGCHLYVSRSTWFGFNLLCLYGILTL